MPSRPVSAPTSSSGLPGPRAAAESRCSMRPTPTHMAFTSGLPLYAGSNCTSAAHRGHADAVAVAADAGHHPGGRGGGLRGSVSGPKRSESSSATGRMPIAKMSRRMPPAPVGRPLVRLQRRGVVVRLHLEDRAPAVAEVYGAGVLLPHLREHVRPLGREVVEERSRVLVPAVLRPQRAGHAQLHLGGLAVEHADQPRVLLARHRHHLERVIVDGHGLPRSSRACRRAGARAPLWFDGLTMSGQRPARGRRRSPGGAPCGEGRERQRISARGKGGGGAGAKRPSMRRPAALQTPSEAGARGEAPASKGGYIQKCRLCGSVRYCNSLVPGVVDQSQKVKRSSPSPPLRSTASLGTVAS